MFIILLYFIFKLEKPINKNKVIIKVDKFAIPKKYISYVATNSILPLVTVTITNDKNVIRYKVNDIKIYFFGFNFIFNGYFFKYPPIR